MIKRACSLHNHAAACRASSHALHDRPWQPSAMLEWLPGMPRKSTRRALQGVYMVQLASSSGISSADQYFANSPGDVHASRHEHVSSREAAARERMALLRSHDRAAYVQLVAQHKCGRLADLLAQTNDCLQHLSQRLCIMRSHATAETGVSSSSSVIDSAGSGLGVQGSSFCGSNAGNTNEAEAWARRMVFDADVTAPPQGLQAELRPYQMKVWPAVCVMHIIPLLVEHVKVLSPALFSGACTTAGAQVVGRPSQSQAERHPGR
jgi:hypothetical protein